MSRRILLLAILALAGLLPSGCCWFHHHRHCCKPPAPAVQRDGVP